MPPAGSASPTPGAATPAPGATGAPSASPGAPFIPGLGTPLDGRLDRTAQVFKAKGNTYLTDLVFGNPNGRTGSVTLRRNSTQLMTLRLENFRDLDFHFVTPIVLGDGQSLVLDLSCEGVTKVEDCDPSLFYSGFIRVGS